MSNSFGFGWTNGWLVFRRVGGRGAGGTKHYERPLRHPILRIAYRKAQLIPDARHPNAPARHRPPGPAPPVARALSAAARVGRPRPRAGALGHSHGRQRQIPAPPRDRSSARSRWRGTRRVLPVRARDRTHDLYGKSLEVREII